MLLSKQCNHILLSLILSSEWTPETERRSLQHNEINLPSRLSNLRHCCILLVHVQLTHFGLRGGETESLQRWCKRQLSQRFKDDDGAGREQWRGRAAAAGSQGNRKMIQKCTEERWGGRFLEGLRKKKLWKCEIQQRRRASSWSRTTINNVSGGVCHTRSSFGDTNYTSSTETPGRLHRFEQLQHSSLVQWSLPPICSSVTSQTHNRSQHKLSRSEPAASLNTANVNKSNKIVNKID